MATMSPRRGKQPGRPPRKPPRGNPWPNKLRDLRAKHGNITQAEAAERAGVTTRTWIAWENAQSIPGRLALNLLRATYPELF